MQLSGWLQLAALGLALLVAARVLGTYIARVYSDRPLPEDRVFAPLERPIYRLAGVTPGNEQRWTGVCALGARLQRRVRARPVRPAARPGGPPPRPRRTSRGSPPACVQHGGQLRHEHELAELQPRDHDEPPHPDERPRGAELRHGRGRARRGGRARPRNHPAAERDDRELLGRPDARRDAHPAAALDRARARAGLARGDPEPPRLHRGADAAGGDAVDPRRAFREPGGDQGARRRTAAGR